MHLQHEYKSHALLFPKPECRIGSQQQEEVGATLGSQRVFPELSQNLILHLIVYLTLGFSHKLVPDLNSDMYPALIHHSIMNVISHLNP